MYNQKIKNEQINDGEPRVMWLSGLHIPESYLTALVQATCRKNGWPLDKSILYTQVTQFNSPDDVTERAHQGLFFIQLLKQIFYLETLLRIFFYKIKGCFVHGLYLEGAGWDSKRSCLVKQNPKELIKELPIMKVIPIESHKLKLQVIFFSVFSLFIHQRVIF